MSLPPDEPTPTLDYEPPRDQRARRHRRASLLTLMPLWCAILVALGLARRWMPWRSDDPFWFAAILLAVGGAFVAGARGHHGDVIICVITAVVVILVSVLLPGFSIPL